MSDVQTIQIILTQYEVASGQKVNREKTNLFFGKGVAEAIKESLKDFLGVPKIKEYEKYLGLPVVVEKNKKRQSCLYKGENLGEITRVAAEITISSG